MPVAVATVAQIYLRSPPQHQLADADGFPAIFGLNFLLLADDRGGGSAPIDMNLQLGSGYSSISAKNLAGFHSTVQRREVDLVNSNQGQGRFPP